MDDAAPQLYNIVEKQIEREIERQGRGGLVTALGPEGVGCIGMPPGEMHGVVAGDLPAMRGQLFLYTCG